MEGLSVQTVARDGNCLFQILSILLEDEGQYNKLRRKLYNKFILYLRAKSSNLQLQLLVKLRVKEVLHLFSSFSTTTNNYSLKF
jgi:hypothetical protein